MGAGFAGPVIVGQRLVLFHRVDGREVVEALDAMSGRPIWRHDYPTTYRDDFGFDEGPRAAPVVVDGRVFTFGAQGQLHALRLDTGEQLWSVDTKARFGFRKGFFGAAGFTACRGPFRHCRRRGARRRDCGIRRRFWRRPVDGNQR